MSSAVQEVRKSLLKLAQTWPRDPLRPSMEFGEAIRRATEAELSGPQARQHLAEARKSLAALERIRSSESLREPESAPTHYTDLVDAMSRVARGQSVAPTISQRVRHFFGLRV
ncbi:acetylornithine transaminase [Malassezia caprae]|uniref:Acetylornithine transaminase n=1 Tax=Malassezia caprae TaxID=1381934 RepID=A0AAF0ITF1_9BASI|nr:acetylornithine transaminase [Malassezia caprae]